jgi:hypothetical protein
LTAQAIADEIEGIVRRTGLAYSAWTIGVTDDPVQRRIAHKNPSVWYQWQTDSEAGGRNVETHFISKGMQGGSGGGGHAGYVYIF